MYQLYQANIGCVRHSLVEAGTKQLCQAYISCMNPIWLSFVVGNDTCFPYLSDKLDSYVIVYRYIKIYREVYILYMLIYEASLFLE